MSYSADFFSKRRAVAQRSAEKILGLVWPILPSTSAIDVGCASGIWLAEAKRRGAINVQGIDGDWVPAEQLEVEPSEFYAHDLSKSLPDGFGKYDIALCIEVAEHLPETAGDSLVEFLTQRADVVLFSAAIPGQGGTGHINEQCQSYWQEKFSNYGYQCFDLIRPQVWMDGEVNVIYKQNMLIYVRKGSASFDKFIQVTPSIEIPTVSYDIDRVHPDLFELRATEARSKKRLGLRKKIKKKLEAFMADS